MFRLIDQDTAIAVGHCLFLLCLLANLEAKIKGYLRIGPAWCHSTRLGLAILDCPIHQSPSHSADTG